MRDFVHRENIKHYKALLERTTDEAERERIRSLFAEEESNLNEKLPRRKRATM